MERDDADRAAARARLVELGVEPSLIDATPWSSWYLLVQEQLFFGGPPTMSAADAASAAGVDEATVRRLWASLGFPDPGSALVFRAADVAMFELYRDGVAVFGEAGTEQFARAAGSAMRAVADAMSALFLDALGPTRVASTVLEHLGLAELGAELNIRTVDAFLRPVLYRHALGAQEFAADAGATATPELRLAVGFCDLVGSTTLHNEVDARLIGTAIADFEAEAYAVVSRRGGRLVKLIGDEVMIAAVDPETAVAIVGDLIAWVATQEVLVGARGGVAHGSVVARGSDLYGPTVNLAARLAGLAPVGGVLVADQAGDEEVEVRGFDAPVRVRRAAAPTAGSA